VDRRWRAAISLGVAVALIGGIVVAAVLADGYARTRADLRDEGVWLTRGSERAVGFLSKASNRLELKFGAPSVGRATITQDKANLVLNDAQGNAAVFDSRTAKAKATLNGLPSGDAVQHRAGTVAVADAIKGTIRVASADGAKTLSGDGQQSFPVKAGQGSPPRLVVGVDASVHALSTTDGSVTTFRRGKVSLRGRVEAVASSMQLSAAGGKPVILDPDRERLIVPGGPTIKLGSHGATLVLQQPSDDPGLVLMASETELVGVHLGSGEVEVLSKESGTAGPVPPLRYRGSSYAAWATPLHAFRLDPTGTKVPYADDPGPRDPAALRWQVGREMVALTDASNGDSFFVDEQDKQQRVTQADWDNALKKEEDKTEEGGAENNKTEVLKQQRQPKQVKPRPQPDDKYGTRVGRPVLVPVLLNDEDDNGDVLVVRARRHRRRRIRRDGCPVQPERHRDRPADLHRQRRVRHG